jgi:UDP-N-acetylglucosamine--N-acetylmuramyl-(pentapeptide) pyrophosphoryl-undecaprenol N-acetylglucosamine transferase
MSHSFVFTGGGTGGHVFPALAVARVLRASGHRVLFVGTEDGMESRLVPEAGFDIEFVKSGGLNRVGLARQLRTGAQLPFGVAAAWRLLKRFRADAAFSMGGYVAGPVMLAAAAAGIPLVIMEPNSVPGFANRRIARRVYRALLGFENARRWFPPDRVEVTGLPVRPEFFALERKPREMFTVLVTGGSRGARTLNRASRESWPLFRASQIPVRILHQTGEAEHAALAREFAGAGVAGEVASFIKDMAAAFAEADVVVGRAGAGGVSEIAAAGMASLLIPLPFAADDHQKKNAQALVDAGAARMILDADLTGERLFREVEELRANPETLAAMRQRVRRFARPGAAERAAAVLEEAAAPKRRPIKIGVFI